jgi:hypothetical protein
MRIGLVSHRAAALLAATGFALTLAEGVLANLCSPELEAESCAGEAIGDMPAAEGSWILSGADGEERSQRGASCCPSPSEAGDLPSGAEDPTSCPFMPLGPTGSCQGASFLAPVASDLLSDVRRMAVFPSSTEARVLLLASALFQPPRD